MKKLRLLGLATALALAAWSQAPRNAYAACPSCTSNASCQQCYGPDAICKNGHCLY
jgi:hypothetical protein